MKAIILLLAFILALSSITYAAVCTDTDGGPIDPAKPTKFVGIKGSVDYGTGPKPDYCISRLGGSGVSESNWLREYYCDAGSISTKDYLCGDYSYDSCKDGACINYTGTQAALDDVGTPQNKTVDAAKNCGNKKLDGLEECDPPHKVCMADGGKMGTCSDACICETARPKNQTNTTQASQAAQNQTAQSGTSQPGSENQASKITFEAGNTEANANAETESNAENETVSTSGTPTGALPAEIEQIMHDTDKEIEDLSNRPGIKITATITNFVMKIWSLFSGLFGV